MSDSTRSVPPSRASALVSVTTSPASSTVDVVAVAADHGVGTESALQRVVAGKAAQRVGEVAAGDDVVERVAGADELVGIDPV